MSGGIVRTRREARERALSLCYELDVRDQPVDELLDELPVPPVAYAAELVRGVAVHRVEIDGLIERFSPRWSVGRMPVVDRALARIATFELGWCPDVPTGVVLAEAVELAGRYSTDDSARFVNGLLSAVAAHLRPGERTP